jgi:hypothetical protein
MGWYAARERHETRWLPGLGGAVGLCLLAIWIGPAVLAVPAGLLLALVLPGLAAVRALFPSRALSWMERLVLVPALSLTVLVLGGLLINVAGVALNRLSWAALTGGVTVVAGVAGYLRSRQAPYEEALSLVSVPEQTTRRAPRLLALVLAGVVLTGAAWLSMRSAGAESSSVSTALSIQDTLATTATTRAVRIQLTSGITGSTAFRVTVTGADGHTTTLSVTLGYGQTWSQSVDVPASGKVSASLYRPADTTAYRTVFLAKS